MLTLTDDSRSASTLRQRLDGRAEIEVGVVDQRWMSVVVDSVDQGEAKDVHRWLESLDEIEKVDVICVSCHEESNSENDE